MKFPQFASNIRYLTNTNDTILPDSVIIMLMNRARDIIVESINRANEDYFVFEYTRDLVAGQREYSLPDDILNHIKKVQVDFNGDGEFDPLDEIDLSNIGATDEESIKKQFAGTARFDISRKSLFIYSGEDIEDVSGGIKIDIPAYPQDYVPADLSSGLDMSQPRNSLDSGIPTPFHDIMLRMCVWYHKYRDESIPETQQRQLDRDMKTKIREIKKFNTKRSIKPKLKRYIGYDY